MVALLVIVMALMDGKANEIPQEELTSFVEEFVRMHTGIAPGDLIVEFRNVPRVPNPRREYSMRISLEHAAPMRGNLSLPVEVVTDGTVLHRVIVSLKVRTFGQVFVSSRKLLKQELLTDADVAVKRVETTSLAQDCITGAEQLRHKRTSRIIGEGTILYQSSLEDMPLIQSNDVVTLRVRAGSVIVSTTCVAKEDGRMGDMVTVQKSGSWERVRGKVLNEKTVEVTLD